MSLPLGCRGTFACIAEYLEHEASDTIFTAFKPAAPSERIYFIGGEDGPVKIGVTTNPKRRLESLQTGCPFPVKILALAPGGRSLERAYHRYFKTDRGCGEWFTRSRDLEDEIKHWSARHRRARLSTSAEVR